MSADGTTREQLVAPAEMAHAELARFRASTGRDTTGNEIRGMLAAYRAVATELAALATTTDVRAFEEAWGSAEQP